MADDQEMFYNKVVEGIVSDLDKVELTTQNALGLTTRLRQATACPSMITSQDISSAKVERALDLIQQITSSGHSVIVFSTFKATIYQLAKQLSTNLNQYVVTGDLAESKINQTIEAFKSDPNPQCLLATWQKIGTGHTLVKASYMIFLDTPWTNGVFKQACDRIHRVGTSKPVFIYNLITAL